MNSGLDGRGQDSDRLFIATMAGDERKRKIGEGERNTMPREHPRLAGHLKEGHGTANRITAMGCRGKKSGKMERSLSADPMPGRTETDERKLTGP